MQKNFLQLRAFLENQYPELRGNITGSNYPSPMIADVLSFLLSIVQMIGLLIVFMGESVFQYIPFYNNRVPDWYYDMKQNPMGAAVMVFFVFPSIVQSFSSTGAFEVIFDDAVIFSKLETGRMPTAPEIVMSLGNLGLKMIEKS